MEQNAKGHLIVRFESDGFSDDDRERVLQLIYMLDKQSSAYRQLENLEPDSIEQRTKAILALRLMMDASFESAVAMSDRMYSVAIGETNASDYGFPEFDDEAEESMSN